MYVMNLELMSEEDSGRLVTHSLWKSTGCGSRLQRVVCFALVSLLSLLDGREREKRERERERERERKEGNEK